MKKFTEHWKRSLVKAITYRIIILLLDFLVVYVLTGQYVVALTFMIVSKIYTSFAYYGHERIWNRISWGKR